ncbi:hypothetical protein HY631_04555 [Candidatus Uhrbacteria bacterium]|nr:hypothetical protein [Candidatus Uhrbacteria bacterium]
MAARFMGLAPRSRILVSVSWPAAQHARRLPHGVTRGDKATRGLIQVGVLLRLSVLDHVVIASDTYASLAASVMDEAPYPVLGVA